MGFQWAYGVYNSIRLKVLQVASGALRKGDKGLINFLFFPKRLFFGFGEDGLFHLFQKRFFLRHWER